MEYYEKEKSLKRKFIEIEKDVSRDLELFCFLKDVPQKQFVSKAIMKELKPYESQLESIKKLKFGYNAKG